MPPIFAPRTPPRDERPPPSPELVQTWGALHDHERRRLMFALYLVRTNRLGRGDLEAAR